jgi:hypothetical protein
MQGLGTRHHLVPILNGQAHQAVANNTTHRVYLHGLSLRVSYSRMLTGAGDDSVKNDQVGTVTFGSSLDGCLERTRQAKRAL